MEHTAPIVVPSGFELPTPRSLARIVAGILAVLAAGIVTASALSFAQSAPADRTAVPLASIPQGVSQQVVDGFAVVAVRTGDAVTTFVGGTPRQELLAYCAPSPRFPDGVLIEPNGASSFDLSGKKLGGPAPRGLDVYPSEVDGDRVLVDTHHPLVANPLPTGPSAAGIYTPRITAPLTDLFVANPSCGYFR